MNAADFVQNIVTELSGAPATVTHQPDDQGVIMDVTATGAIASVIGKDGRTIEAIRTIANALGQDGKHRIRVRLNEQRESAN